MVNAMKRIEVVIHFMLEESSPALPVVVPLHAQLIDGLPESPSDSTMTKEIKSATCLDLKKSDLDQKENLYGSKALTFLSKDNRLDIYVKSHCRSGEKPAPS